MGRPWLRSGEAARLLGVDRSTIDRWASAGAVAHTRTLGGQRRFDRADIEALADALTDLRNQPMERIGTDDRCAFRNCESHACDEPWCPSHREWLRRRGLIA